MGNGAFKDSTQSASHDLTDNAVRLDYPSDKISSSLARQLTYLDEVSSVPLQRYDMHMYDKVQSLLILDEGWMLQNMEEEWLKSDETLHHWNYVVNPVPAEPQLRGHDSGHESWSLDNFLNHEVGKIAGLFKSDIMALRLYTGSGYQFINESLRSADGKFCVTVFCTNRAIGKIAKSNITNQETFPRIFYRGLKGRLRVPFRNMYSKDDSTSIKNAGRICDRGLMSTTSNIEVATGKYGGEILFAISGTYSETKDDDSENYEYVSNPAPVKWVSQYPEEEEYLWPTYTALIPKQYTERTGINGNGSMINKEIYEFTAVYIWDTELNCIGRYKNIPSDEVEMLRMAVQFSKYSYGMQDVWLAVPGLLVNQEVDEDINIDDAISIAFSLFDKGAIYKITVDSILETVNILHSIAANAPLDQRKYSQIKEELQSLVTADDGYIHWTQFRQHFICKEYSTF